MGQPGYPQQQPQNVPPAPQQGGYPPPPQGGYPPPAQGAYQPQGGYPPPSYPPPAFPPSPQPAGNPQRSEASKRGLLQIGLGVGMIVLGIVISVVTYALAANGGVYFVAYGLPIFGIISIVRGLITMVRGR